MDRNVPGELEKRYQVARLNWEKSERAAGQLARFLACQAIAARLVVITAERCGFGGHLHLAHRVPVGSKGFALPPVPHEVREAMGEMRAWRAATLEAYERLPSATRTTMSHLA